MKDYQVWAKLKRGEDGKVFNSEHKEDAYKIFNYMANDPRSKEILSDLKVIEVETTTLSEMYFGAGPNIRIVE